MRSSVIELPPRLMVSVRDGIDWDIALEAGVEIVDLPWAVTSPDAACEPDPLLLRRAGDRSHWPAQFGIAMDCGELSQRPDLATALPVPEFVRWARLGLANMADGADWSQTWVDARRRLDAERTCPLSWWAVAYADYDLARAPTPTDVLTAALETRCAGLMLDTWIKSGPSLADLMPPPALTMLLERARECQLPVVIAGGVESDDLEWVCDLEPAVIAVRSSVSRYGEYDQPLSPTRLAWFRQSLDDAVEFDRVAWQATRELQGASSNTPA